MRLHPQGSGGGQGGGAANPPAATPAPQAPQARQFTFAVPPAGQKWTPEQRQAFRDELRSAIRDGNVPMINVPSDFVQNAVPRGAVDISMAFFLTIAVIAIGVPFARAMGRRMDARSQRLAQGPDLRPQIEALQQSVDAMAVELERISEAQRFQSKLMAGKAEPEPARLP